MSRTRRCRKSAGCMKATLRGSGRWWSTGSDLPSAVDNRPLKFAEFERDAQAGDLCVGDTGSL